MKKKKILMLLGVLSTSMTLSGCVSSMSGHKVVLEESSNEHPVIVNNYDYQGQKVDQFKLNKATIKSDNEITSAIDVDYGENRIIHSSSALIAYTGVTNYADRYAAYNARQATLAPYEKNTHQAVNNKSLPTSGDVYHLYHHEWPTNGTVVEVKTGSGSLIGCFVGYKASLTDFGISDNSTAIINLDGHKIFVHDVSYTLYPISAMKSMDDNNKATNRSLQADVKTHDGLADATNTVKKHK